MFDSHCHLTFPQYEGRVDRVLAEAAAVGVRGAITVATTTADCVRALTLARAHASLWCTAGVHPLHSDEPIDWDLMHECARDSRCVAWGELGLDHHYPNPPRALQVAVLTTQLEKIRQWRAEGLEKPIVIHCREAFDDLLAILRHSALPPDRFVLHCFTGTQADARKVLDFGAWISFTGVVTFRNAPEVAAAATFVPLDRMMVETDAPFLTPEPHRTVRPNEPRYVVHVAQRLAELRGLPYDQLDAALDANVERFFGILLPQPALPGGSTAAP